MTINNTGIFNWDKELIVDTLDRLVSVKEDKKIISAERDSAYYGRSISTSEKWQHGLEIAGIIVGTLLILPIPILVSTGCFRRLARLVTELNKNISIEGKINNFADQVFKNEDKILNGTLKVREETIEAELLDRIQKCYKEMDKANGTIRIQLVDLHKDTIDGDLLYEFQYDKNQTLPFKTKLIESHLSNTKLFKNCSENNLKDMLFGKSILLQDKNGKILNDYFNSQRAYDFLPENLANLTK